MLKPEASTKRFIAVSSIVAISGFALLVACSDDGTSSSSSSSSSGGTSGSSGGTSGASSGASSGSTGSSTTQKFSCSLNGACYKCPSSDAVIKCARDGASAAGCTSAESSFCEE